MKQASTATTPATQEPVTAIIASLRRTHPPEKAFDGRARRKPQDAV